MTPVENAAPAERKGSASKPALAPVKDRIFLIDAMSFIFRAYHAMARQRGMSTKTGLPTAATYVFVNMLRKLRDDFLRNIWLRFSMWPRLHSAISRPEAHHGAQVST